MTIILTDTSVNQAADYKTKVYKDNSTGSTTQVIALGRLSAGVIVPYTDADPLKITGSLSVGASTASAITTETIINVATSSTAVLASNSSRKGGWVKNISDTDMFVSFSGTATTSKPTKVAPGESLFLALWGGIYTGAVSAIHASTGTKDLEVVEL